MIQGEAASVHAAGDSGEEALGVSVGLSLPIWFHYYGVEGIVVATALSEVPVLLVLWPAFRAEGLFVWSKELRSFALVLVGYAAGAVLEPVMRSVIL
jgi:hypothetical protein